MSNYRSGYSGQEIDGAVSATTYMTGGIPANPSTIGTPTRLFVYNGKLYYFDGQTRHVIAGGSEEEEQPLLFGDGLRKENNTAVLDRNSVVSAVQNGLMSSSDKSKLDALNESHIKGLNVLCVGDSITAGQGMTTATRWANVMATQHDWTLTVKAQGGISMSNYYYREHSMTEVGCVSQIDYIAQMNPKPDLVIVWAGHNDTSYRHSPLGSFANVAQQDRGGVLPTYADRYSFKGSIRYISEVVHSYAPKATLVFLTTEWRSLTPSTLQVPAETTDTNDMFDEAIMENGWRYGYIPLNMSLCGITPFTLGTTTSDNVHPNEAGTRLIVKYLSSELNKIYYIYGIDSIRVTGITLNKATTTILTGQTEQLSATVSPRDATNQNVNWTSSNTAVATVDSSGLVTAGANGNATITATTVDGGFSASCSVIVESERVPVTGVSLSPSTLSMTIGESANLVATITPANATNQNLVWTSSDDQTIDVLQQNGHITALNVGSGVVTVRTEDGNFTATCSVTIGARQNYYVLESLNSLPHSQWTLGSMLGQQYFAYDGANSVAQLSGQTIGKVFCSTKSGTGLSGSMTITLYDVPLVNGSAAPPSQWTEVESKTFNSLTNSMPLEWTLTNPHTVQSGHTIGLHANKAFVGTYDSTQVSVTLATHYFNDAAATTSSSISLNAYDFYVQAQS